MEATHFISVIKGYEGKFFNMPCQKMHFLQYTLNEDYGYAETVAVWRIKPTDVPLYHRLGERIMKGMICDIETYKRLCQPLSITESEVSLFQYTRKYKIPTT